MAKVNTKIRSFKQNMKMQRMQNRYSLKKMKVAAKNKRLEVKAKEPVELIKEKQKTARHAAWATALTNAVGKASNLGQTAVTGARQNIIGGLTNTSKSREEDEEGVDKVDSGGVVY
jgi:hypothetical protein